MLNDKNDLRATAKFSFAKVAGLEVGLLVCAVLPVLPHFGDRLSYGKLFYTPAFFPVLLIACAFLFFMFIINFPLLIRSIINQAVLNITEDKIYVCGIRLRVIAIVNITMVGPPRYGSVRITTSEKGGISIPVFLYRNPSMIYSKIALIKTVRD